LSKILLPMPPFPQPLVKYISLFHLNTARFVKQGKDLGGRTTSDHSSFHIYTPTFFNPSPVQVSSYCLSITPAQSPLTTYLISNLLLNNHQAPCRFHRIYISPGGSLPSGQLISNDPQSNVGSTNNPSPLPAQQMSLDLRPA
jgi:hypothetical protein